MLLEEFIGSQKVTQGTSTSSTTKKNAIWAIFVPQQ